MEEYENVIVEESNCHQCTADDVVVFQTEDGKDFRACGQHVLGVLEELRDEYGNGNYVAVFLGDE